jgi:hypothetical protein
MNDLRKNVECPFKLKKKHIMRSCSLLCFAFGENSKTRRRRKEISVKFTKAFRRVRRFALLLLALHIGIPLHLFTKCSLNIYCT